MEGPYRLYSWRNSYSMTAQAALEELGLSYELLWTRIHVPLPEKDPDFLAANPNGRVPTLLTPDGPLYESGAILVYLAERHPDAGLMPPPGDPMRRPGELYSVRQLGDRLGGSRGDNVQIGPEPEADVLGPGV